MANVVNPYSFIPLREAPQRAPMSADYSDPSVLLSGWFEIVIRPETELIISDGRPMDGVGKSAREIPASDNTSHRCYHFARTADGVPMIPGSSLRGMIRSMYEAASNSCFPLLLDDGDITTRAPVYGAWKDRGLLAKTGSGWTLYKAEVYKDRRPYGIKGNGAWYGLCAGDIVHFRVGSPYEAIIDDSGPLTGWLQYQNPVRKDNYHAAVLVQQKAIASWSDNSPYKKLKAALEATISSRTAQSNVHKMLLRALNNANNGNGNLVPVWYNKVGSDYYFSPSSIGRVMQHNKWGDILENYSPCDREDSLCPACRLFGTVNAGAFRGRVRFGDALPLEVIGPKAFSFRTLPILATPRPTAFEFYLKRPAPDATYWNFDYHVTGSQYNARYSSSPRTLLRGRKYYWHSKPDTTNALRGKMNTTMELLASGDASKFSFRLYFDCITQRQLDELKWVITLGENSSSGHHMHKLGHGRPLGYGSVKLSVDKLIVRSFTLSSSGAPEYRLCEEKLPISIPSPWGETNQIKSILAMTDSRSVSSYTVAYPMEDRRGSIAIFNWFSQNRTNRGPTSLLPAPTDRDLSLTTTLPSEEYTVEASNRRGSGRNPAAPPRPASSNHSPRDIAGNEKRASVPREDWTGRETTVTIYKIKSPGFSANCNLRDGSRGFLKSPKSLESYYQLSEGDSFYVKVTGYSKDFNSWQLVPAPDQKGSRVQ